VFFGVPVFPSRLTPLADGRFGTTFPQEPDDPVAQNANLAKKNEINAATKDISGSLFFADDRRRKFQKKAGCGTPDRSDFLPKSQTSRSWPKHVSKLGKAETRDLKKSPDSIFCTGKAPRRGALAEIVSEQEWRQPLYG